MNLHSIISNNILQVVRSKTIGVLTGAFALLYHSVFLVLFYKMGVTPMFYFNIGSVIIFSIVLVLAIKLKDLTTLYHISYLEVIVHQILADNFLGGASSFHFFILLMGFLAFFVIPKFKLAVFYGIISSFLFIGFEVASPFITIKYAISDKMLFSIKLINVGFSIVVTTLAILIFAFIVNNVERALRQEVKHQLMKNDQLQQHIIYSLASLVENRDTDTGDHVQRTSQYVTEIAKAAMQQGLYPDEITPDFINLLKRAAPMHDIGKIVVSDAILKKPGRLTAEEFEQIKLHTTEGGRIVDEIIGLSEDKDYVRIAREVATSHHERWDGKGYPSGLMTNQIPLSARIMAIADVFDALISSRCYKEPMPLEKALQIIEDESGSHFDPILAKVFLSIQKKQQK